MISFADKGVAFRRASQSILFLLCTGSVVQASDTKTLPHLWQMKDFSSRTHEFEFWEKRDLIGSEHEESNLYGRSVGRLSAPQQNFLAKLLSPANASLKPTDFEESVDKLFSDLPTALLQEIKKLADHEKREQRFIRTRDILFYYFYLSDRLPLFDSEVLANIAKPWASETEEEVIPNSVSLSESEKQSLRELAYERVKEKLGVQLRVYEPEEEMTQSAVNFLRLEVLEKLPGQYEMDKKQIADGSSKASDSSSFLTAFLYFREMEGRTCSLPLFGIRTEGKLSFFVAQQSRAKLEDFQKAVEKDYAPADQEKNSRSVHQIRLEDLDASLEFSRDLTQIRCAQAPLADSPIVSFTTGKNDRFFATLYLLRSQIDDSESVALFTHSDFVKRGRSRDCANLEERTYALHGSILEQENMIDLQGFYWAELHSPFELQLEYQGKTPFFYRTEEPQRFLAPYRFIQLKGLAGGELQFNIRPFASTREASLTWKSRHIEAL